MKTRISNFLKNNQNILFLSLLSWAILPIVYFFWVNNNLLNWDFPGHIAQIYYYRENLLPFLSGWNNEYSLGYPQGDFYPILIHYFIALLTLIYNNPYFWIKVVFAFVMLILPFCIYFFISSFAKNAINYKFSFAEKYIATFITLLAIILGPVLYGGTLQSFTIVGLMNNLLIMPAFFLYLGFLLGFNKKVDLTLITLASLLLIIIILSHLVVALVCVTFTIFFWVWTLITNLRDLNQKSSKKLFQIIFFNNSFITLSLSFLMTAFFTIPLIIYQDLVTSQIMVMPDRITVLGLTLITTAILYMAIKGHSFINQKLFWPIAVPMVLIVIYCIIEVAVFALFSMRLLTGIVQSYRILAFALVLFPGIATLLLMIPLKNIQLSRKSFLKSKLLYFLLVIPVILLTVSFFQNPNVKSYITPSYNEKEISKRTDGNYFSLVLADYPNAYIRSDVYSNLSTGINIKFINALFAESTYHETLVASLRSSIDENDFSANKPSRKLYPDTYKIGYEEIRNIFTLLDIKYVLYSDSTRFKYQICSDEKFEFASLDIKSKTDGPYKIYGCKVSKDVYKDSFETENAKNNWDETYYNFVFDQKDIVFTDKEVDSKAAKPFPGYLNWWKGNQQFSIFNKKDGLIILPVQYNPKWKAYEKDCCGNFREVEIYRVTPNLIGVEEKGMIYFEYETSVWEKALSAISGVSIILLILALIYSFTKKILLKSLI